MTSVNREIINFKGKIFRTLLLSFPLFLYNHCLMIVIFQEKNQTLSTTGILIMFLIFSISHLLLLLIISSIIVSGESSLNDKQGSIIKSISYGTQILTILIITFFSTFAIYIILFSIDKLYFLFPIKGLGLYGVFLPMIFFFLVYLLYYSTFFLYNKKFKNIEKIEFWDDLFDLDKLSIKVFIALGLISPFLHILYGLITLWTLIRAYVIVIIYDLLIKIILIENIPKFKELNFTLYNLQKFDIVYILLPNFILIALILLIFIYFIVMSPFGLINIIKQKIQKKT